MIAIRLVLADDHPLILSGLEYLFQEEPDCEVLARCGNGRDALEAVRRHQPDILVLDSRMPFLDGLGVLRVLALEASPVRVVFLAESLEEEMIQDAVRLGARGVVLKDMPPGTLLQCVRKIHNGEYWLERRAASLAVEAMVRREAARRTIAAQLTSREMEILPLLCRGLPNREIGKNLSISAATVKVHVRNIYAKLHVKTRMELLRYTEEKGLL